MYIGIGRRTYIHMLCTCTYVHVLCTCTQCTYVHSTCMYVCMYVCTPYNSMVQTRIFHYKEILYETLSIHNTTIVMFKFMLEWICV